MRKLSKLAAIRPVILKWAAALFIAPMLMVSPGCSPCDNEMVSEYLSPDGRMKAVVFIRSCGATTPIVTEMSIVPAHAGIPRGWANALTVSDDPEHPIERSTEAIEVRLKWNSSDHLSVLFPRAANIGKRAMSVDGVAIEYGTF
jgi:hypothetical protein